MLGNFIYHNPTKVFFGETALDYLHQELPHYGKNVQLAYGKGSIKRSGLYDEIVAILKAHDKNIIDDGGVMPNPTMEKVYEGIALAKEHDVDLILAVGGGSVCDYAKAVSVSTWCDEDPWEKYYLRQERVDNRIIPVGCILTMAGTGSEMNGGSVITHTEQNLKIGHNFDSRVFPKFAILNPTYTYSLPRKQLTAGTFDIMVHIMEQYFSGDDDNVTDDIAEGMMRSVVKNSYKAMENPEDYIARSNLMWAATWGLNTFLGCGKSTDFMVHMLGKSIGAYTDATHGLTLSSVIMPYYRNILPYGLDKFARFAVNVWQINPEGKSKEALAEQGLAALENWMQDLDLVLNLRDLGVTENMLPGIQQGVIITKGGYKKCTEEDVMDVLTAAMDYQPQA